MAAIMLEKLKQPLFNLFYIMTEGKQVDAGFAAYRNTIFLLFVDVLQVVRVMCSLRYGWTEDTQGVIEKTDIVYMFTKLVSSLIPRYSFFILAAILVLVALLDSYYVVKLFKAGNVQKLWPVKLLRFLVTSLVTILFISVVNWLLIPIECIVSKEKSFSDFVHNGEDLCTPWGMPEVLISIPTILLAAAYITFALGASYLAFEINPLSRNPRAMYTGRVELLFAFHKVAVTLLVYLSDLLTPVVISIIFFLWTFHVFRQHLRILPYHSEATNDVRGGIYGMVLWWAFASIITSSIHIARHDTWETEEHPGWVQPLQWALAGILPLAFLLGLSLTAFTQYRVGRSLLRLRGDFEKPANAADADTEDGKVGRLASLNRSSLDMPLPSAHVPRVGVKRGVFEKFFDTEWESRRRFANEWRAGVLLRSLLHRRNKDDLLFMQFLVGKAIQEHPESMQLQLQLLVLHRFVFRDASEAAEIQRALKLDQKTLPFDCQYILFVAERKSNQALRGTEMGGGSGAMTGIRLMEFDISFGRARKAHLACVSKMRAFWRMVEKKRTASFDTLQAQDLVKSLDEFESESVVANKEYEALVEKYPQSVQLLRSYAHFCDTVLNDIKKAETYQRNATILEGDDDDVEEEEEEGSREKLEFAAEKEGGGSTYSSEAEPYRVVMQRYLLSQSDLMMGKEAHAVNRLHMRVGMALLLLLVITTSGFVLNDNYLFSGLALHNMDQIDKTGLLRSYALNTAFELRGIQLASIYNNTAYYEENKKQIGDMMSTWRERHRTNYETMTSKLKDYYLNSELSSYVPVEGVWQRHTNNFWTLGNEFARRAERASQSSMEELRDPSYRLGKMSYEKENVAYVYENLERETRKDLRVVVDFFQEEMENFGVLAIALVIGNVCINAILVLLISFFVLRALAGEMRTMQSALVFCSLALSLPRSTANAIYKYYDTVELNMKILEEEDAERNAIMQSDVSLRRKASVVSTEGLPTALMRRASSGTQDEKAMMRELPASEGGGALPGAIGRRPSSIMRPSSAVDDGPGASPLAFAFPKEEERSESASDRSPGAAVTVAQPCQNVMRWLSRDQEEPPQARGGEEGEGLANEEVRAEAEEKEEEELEERIPQPERNVWHNRLASAQAETAMVLAETDGGHKERSGAGGAYSKRDKKGETEWSKRSGKSSPEEEEELEESEEEREERVPASGKRRGLRSPGPGLATGSRGSQRQSPSPPADEEGSRRGGITRGGRRRSTGSEEEWSKRSVTLAAPEEAVEWAMLCEGVLRAERAKVREAMRRRRRDKGAGALRREASSAGDGKKHAGSRQGESAASKSFASRFLGSIGLTWGAPPPKAPPTETGEAVDGRPENFLEESRESLAIVVQKQMPWHTRVEVYFAVCFAVLFICIFSMVYPSRHIDDIVNLAPVANQAGRRRSLASSCVHYSRELVLDDGFSRMTKEETAGALSSYLEALREADTAVRIGGAGGIRVGSDFRNAEHNDAMYGEGCAWREDPSDCSMPGFEGRSDVARHGLSYLLKSFEDAVEKVLARYAPGMGDSTEWNEHRPDVASPDMFAEVHTKTSRVDLLTDDPDLKFIMAAANDGDVSTGLGKMLSIFHDETSHVLKTSQAETRLLFGVYVSVVAFGFYYFLFRRTIKLALSEVTRTRGLVMSMPSHVLKKENVQAIVHFFAPADKNRQDEEEHEALQRLNQNQPTAVDTELENKRTELARKMAELQQEQSNLKGAV